MSKKIPIPHNPRVSTKYSMPLTSNEIFDYDIFKKKILELGDYYTSTGYEIVLIEFGMNRSLAEGRFYARIYMNDAQNYGSNVGTIIPTLGNIIETEDILLFKAKEHE